MLKYMDEVKQTLEKEIDKISKTGDISVNTLEKLHKLTDTYKNLCKISILSEEEDGGYSEAGDWMGEGRMYGTSYARGRGKYAKRDRMGRYSSDMHDEEYSERRVGRGYSRDEGKDMMMNRIGELMEDADPKEREALKRCMRALEEA